MIDFIIKIFQDIMETIGLIGTNMASLSTRIDSIVFTEDVAISRFFGMLHYLMGTPLYDLMCLTLLIGLGFALYKLAKAVVKTVNDLSAKMRGKFLVP